MAEIPNEKTVDTLIKTDSGVDLHKTDLNSLLKELHENEEVDLELIERILKNS